MMPGSTPRSARQLIGDVLVAGACAAVLSGIPSTLHALLTGGDPMQATRAAGSMLVSPASTDAALFAAAAVVHLAITLFWATVLVLALPRRRPVLWSLAALAVIAVLDLRLIARFFFPEVHALPFWPQFADHLAWGASFGAALKWRRSRGILKIV
jgi:hypothetical protein